MAMAVTIKDPNKSKDLLLSAVVQPKPTNSKVTNTNDAIVIPETGKLDVPTVPVKRPDTMVNRRAKIIDKIDANKAIIIFPPEIKNPAAKEISTPAIKIIRPRLPLS